MIVTATQVYERGGHSALFGSEPTQSLNELRENMIASEAYYGKKAERLSIASQLSSPLFRLPTECDQGWFGQF
jgi:hypothetical protein